MKKLIVMMFAFVLSASSVFGATNFFDLEDAAKIDADTNASATLKEAVKKVIGKNSKNTSYEQLKAIFYDEKNFNDWAAQFVIKSDRFSDFIPNLIKDKDVKEYNYINNYCLFYKRIFEKFDKKDWYARVLYMFKYNASKNNIAWCTDAINFYSNNIDSFTDAEIKENMKAFKRIVYPKIGVSDEWKQLAVKIELMLKSVE